MGYCWYCYWGWSKKVADIYDSALNKLDGYESPLHFGFAHIVWDDENFDFDSIRWCLEHKEEYGKEFSKEENDIVEWSLKELLKLPENEVDIEPTEYDDEHPELYPPTIEVVKR